MARLASQIKGGWYPAAPEAVAAVLDRLRPPATGECLVLDNCAGQGMALMQLADGLNGVPYGIELSEDRAAILASLVDDVLAPADFLRTATSPGAFSLVWCNPPYDAEAGGGRVEDAFMRKAVGLLAEGGVLALVCPEDVANSREVSEFFEERFENISAMPFPEEVRAYSETVIMGAKRRTPMPIAWGQCGWGWLERKMEERIVYTLPAGHRPKVWKVTEPTDAELVRLVATSPLRFLLEPHADRADLKPRPPMSPGIGHRAMMMASGNLDGAIHPPGERPHVIRGSARKDQYVSSSETTTDDDGNETTRTVMSEKPVLTIRVLDADGTIITLE